MGFGTMASYLVQYKPTVAMEKAHEKELQRVANAEIKSKEPSLAEDGSSEKTAPTLNSTDLDQIKTLLINITGAIQQNSNLMHKIVSLSSTNKDEIIGSVQSLQEKAEQQHGYIQSQVKDVKRTIKEMWN